MAGPGPASSRAPSRQCPAQTGAAGPEGRAGGWSAGGLRHAGERGRSQSVRRRAAARRAPDRRNGSPASTGPAAGRSRPRRKQQKSPPPSPQVAATAGRCCRINGVRREEFLHHPPHLLCECQAPSGTCLYHHRGRLPVALPQDPGRQHHVPDRYGRTR